MKLKHSVLFFFLMITLSGCYQKFLSLVYNDNEIKIVRIEGKFPKIEIFDLRLQTSDRKLKRPGFFSMPGWKDIVYPKLTEDNKKEITRAINRQFTNEGGNFKVTCILRNSMQKRSVHLFNECIFVTVELEIFLYDDKNNLLDSYITTEYQEHKSMMILNDDIELLYNKALRNAVHKCFISFKKIDSIKSHQEYYRNSNMVKYKK